MSKELFIASSPHETKVAVLEDDQLVEVYFERDTDVGLVGGIYKGRVNRVLPGMQSAFVDIGLERDAFLYVSDFVLEDQEEYEKVFEEAEGRVSRGAAEEASAQPSATQTAPAAQNGSAPTGEAATLPESPPGVILPVAPTETAQATSTPAATVPEPLASVPVPSESQVAAPTAAGATPNPNPASNRFFSEGQRRPSPGEGSDYRRGEHRGPRRRRRGRGGYGNRERRFGSRQGGSNRQDVGPPGPGSHTFEVLPGESLAKYGHGPSEGSQIEPISESHSGSVRAAEDASAPWHPEVVVPSPAESHTEPSSPVATECSPTTHERFENEPGHFEAEAHHEETPTRPLHTSSTSQGDFTGYSEALPARAADREASGAEGARSPESSYDYASEWPSPEAAETPSERVAAPSEHEKPPCWAAESGEVAASPTPGASETPWEGTNSTSTEAPSAQPGEALASGVQAQTPAADSASGSAERTFHFREPHQRPRFGPRRGRRGRGMGQRRPPEGRREGPRPGNHQPRPIAELLKEGQEILVQIAKEPLGTKGARITSHIALPGRYVVYMPTINHIGVSRKIASEEERLRLRNIILDHKGSLTGGFIVRTAGGGRSEEEIKADLKFLATLWSEIRTKAEQSKAPALIHRDLDLVQRILRDTLSPDFKCVRVDTETDYERALDFVSRCQPSLVGAVKLHTREAPLFEEFGIQAEVEKALKPKVWLKSGGYIVINQTEALVAIDVNTGKYVGKTNRLEDTILKTNIDAVKEIVRQVRLRDLGGIIVIDFIDMDERKNRFKVIQALEDSLRHDRAPTKIVNFNEFGLVAITRKRVKQSLERTLCEPCQYCSGAGWIKSLPTVCNEILAEARKMAAHIEGKVITLRVNPEVAKALKSREGVLISEIESITRKELLIKSDPTVHQERFEVF